MSRTGSVYKSVSDTRTHTHTPSLPPQGARAPPPTSNDCLWLQVVGDPPPGSASIIYPGEAGQRRTRSMGSGPSGPEPSEEPGSAGSAGPSRTLDCFDLLFDANLSLTSSEEGVANSHPWTGVKGWKQIEPE